jgi:beta-lactamase regulating signal transducer with metallopeptidase domain
MTIELLDILGRDLGSWLVGATAWTAVLLAAALLADLALRRFVSPGARMLLFAVVFARLALPIDFASPLGLLPAVEHAAMVLPEVTAAASASAPQPAMSVEEVALPWGVAVLAAYALGVVVLGTAIIASHRRLRLCMRRAGRERALPGGAPVLEHRSAGPLALAGRVVIPTRLFEELDAHELQAVVRHERAHLRHRDPLLVGALAALCIVAWPVLPLWIAAHRIRFLIELRADATAVAGLDAAERNTYRKVLLRVAALRWAGPAFAPGLGPVSALEARLAALGGTGFGPVWLQLGAAAAIGGAFLCCSGHREPADTAEALATMPVDVVRTCRVPVVGAEHEPTDPALVEVSARLRAELAAAVDPQRILDEAQRLGLRRVGAEARLVYGRQLAAEGRYEEAEHALEEAAWHAAATKHDGIATVAAGELVTLGLTRADSDAFAWQRHYEAAHKRIGGAPLPHEERMLLALVAHHEATGNRDAIPPLQARLALVRDACLSDL